MDGSSGGDRAMAEAALRDFRRAVYRGLRGWADALFELSDALLEAGSPVGSVPALSLEPVFRRGHGSLYKALARGRIDAGRVRAALAAARPTDWPAVFAVDASTWPRCDAETSPERGFYYHPSRHSAGQPIVAGWSYQWIAGLSFTPDSWTAPLDVARLCPTDNTTVATLAQVRGLVERLGQAGPDRRRRGGHPGCARRSPPGRRRARRRGRSGRSRRRTRTGAVLRRRAGGRRAGAPGRWWPPPCPRAAGCAGHRGERSSCRAPSRAR